MNATRVLDIAKKKLQYSKDMNQLCAYLTPTEIHALIADGYKPIASCATRIPNRNEAKPKPTWFYFLPNRGEFYE
jgi:hypothetical protein